MKNKTNKRFTPLVTNELENTFGGKTIRVCYVEDGVLKWKYVEVK